MQTRRATLVALAGVGATALSGCTLFEDTIEASAQPAAVAESAVDATDFEHDQLTDQVHEETVEVGERPTTVLGRSITVDEFDARTQQEGIDLRLHMADRTHEGDLLVAFGLHPELLDLTADIDTLAEGTTHPTERPS